MVVAVVAMAAAPAQRLAQPPFPVIYNGNVTIMDAPAPTDVSLVACVDGCDTGWQSNLALIPEPGKYTTLVVGPPDHTFIGKELTFHLVTEFGSVQAAETGTLTEPKDPSDFTKTLDLHFAEAPPAAPEATPTPTPTITPTPSPTPVLPIPGDASVPRLSRVALIAGSLALLAGVGILFLMRRRKAL